jgi:hypothetical protein
VAEARYPVALFAHAIQPLPAFVSISMVTLPLVTADVDKSPSAIELPDKAKLKVGVTAAVTVI